jgi:hypothetical protein
MIGPSSRAATTLFTCAATALARGRNLWDGADGVKPPAGVSARRKTQSLSNLTTQPSAGGLTELRKVHEMAVMGWPWGNALPLPESRPNLEACD